MYPYKGVVDAAEDEYEYIDVSCWAVAESSDRIVLLSSSSSSSSSRPFTCLLLPSCRIEFVAIVSSSSCSLRSVRCVEDSILSPSEKSGIFFQADDEASDNDSVR